MRRLAMAVLVAGVCLGAPAPAAAQTSAPDAALEACVAAAGASRAALEGCKGVVAEPCIEAPGGETSGGMLRCYNAEARAWTVMLDAVLARAAGNEARASALAQAQEAWRIWRDAECRYQASLYAGGSLERVLAASCMADLVADRAVALIYQERIEDM